MSATVSASRALRLDSQGGPTLCAGITHSNNIVQNKDVHPPISAQDAARILGVQPAEDFTLLAWDFNRAKLKTMW